MPIDYIILGKRIALFRAKASLSQDKLADMVHVNKYHISRIEKGHASPSPDLLYDIAQALGVTVDDLLFDQSQPTTSFVRLQQLLDGCSFKKQEIIVRNAENLKRTLDDLDIK